MSQPLIYLNNAATTWPKPKEVHEAIQESLSTPPFGSGRTAGTQGTDYITETRDKLADLFSCNENICFTHNATDSLNILISGFLSKHTDIHVLTTELDHNSVLRPLHEAQKSGKCTYTAIPFDVKTGKISPDIIENCITKDTKLAVISHASNVLGTIQDIKKIVKHLHEHDIFVITDGAQSAGHIPINLKNLKTDAFAFTGHKGLFGIPGTGGFWINEPEQIEPTRFGGTGTDSNNLSHPREMPDRYETGTHNYVGLATLSAGIDYLRKQGIKTIHEHGISQITSLINGLKKTDTIHLQCEKPDIPILSFTIDNLTPDDIGFILSRRYNIVTRTGLHCAPLVHKRLDNGTGSVRISLSAMTTDTECTVAENAITEVAQSAASCIHSA